VRLSQSREKLFACPSLANGQVFTCVSFQRDGHQRRVSVTGLSAADFIQAMGIRASNGGRALSPTAPASLLGGCRIARMSALARSIQTTRLAIQASLGPRQRLAVLAVRHRNAELFVRKGLTSSE
jgi:hypothetical protein